MTRYDYDIGILGGGAAGLTVAAGAGTGRMLEADALLVATGRRPNVEDLGLEAAGVVCGPKEITADARLRTSRPHIYACGDVNGVLPFTHVAGYEGGIALTNAILRLPRKADYTKVPWCTYTDPEVASVGLNERRAREAGSEYRVLEERYADNDRALAEGEPDGKIKVLVNPKGAVIGCQIVGARAGELIAEWVAALAGGVKLSALAYFSEKIFSDRTRGLLRLFFGLKGRACTPPGGP